MMRRALLALALLLQTVAVLGHEVHHSIEATGALALRLTYADGKPFSFEAFEAYPDGADVPAQVARTDAQGRAVFVPGDTRNWRVKAFSADGHGVDLRFEAPPVAAPPTATPTATGDCPNRASLLLFGVSLLLGGFGMYQLWLRNRK